MKEFIKKCDEKTLFLIDEFGTGSDPELGGALAEAILEVFYEKKSLGLITTHYTNLKLLANELDSMENANMQFNEDTLEPVFNLITGEAGSSFTFEVAQKNGLPYSIINKAKQISFEKVKRNWDSERQRREFNNQKESRRRMGTASRRLVSFAPAAGSVNYPEASLHSDQKEGLGARGSSGRRGNSWPLLIG